MVPARRTPKRPSADNIRNPAKLAPAAADQICLTCHLNQPTQVGRLESSHAQNQISCTACHKVHSSDQPLVVRKADATNKLCASCHLSEWAQFQRPFHHKLPEGDMSCVDCHNPHGSIRPAMLQSFAANEPGCFKCHGDKRGPFTFEHAPVRFEGCQACHEPHGSANPRMLTRADVRFVCLECHANLPSIAGESDGRGAAVISRFALACVSELHGVPSEDSWQPRGSESTQMRALLDRSRAAGPSACAAGTLPPAPVRDASAGCDTRARGSADSGNAASPVPSTEPLLTGWIDFGYLWNTGVGGSYDTYRSIIDIHSGPKLLGADFTLTDPKHRWFDTIQVRATTWGAEPCRVAARRSQEVRPLRFQRRLSRLRLLQLPAFVRRSAAQPRRRAWTSNPSIPAARSPRLSLDIRPGHWWTPYFGWDHDSAPGTGASVFVSDSNEYPVPNTLCDSTDLYRGGVRFEKPHFHLTLEEGGTAFKSDQSLYQAPGSVNSGNFSAPVFGQTLNLTSLLAAYGIGGSSAYSKALLTASPTTWLDIYGQFLYSQPNTNVHYQQYDTGNLYLQSQILFYSSEQEIISAAAEQPHTTGSLGAEIRPFKRVRIVENWMTDRLHDAGSSSLARHAAGRRITPRAQCAARFHIGDELQPGVARHLFRCEFQAHAARRLPLCMGRCELRVPAAGGLGQLPTRSNCGKTSESARPLSGPRRKSR